MLAMTRGVAWFLPEQWGKLREISADRDLLEIDHRASAGGPSGPATITFHDDAGNPLIMGK